MRHKKTKQILEVKQLYVSVLLTYLVLLNFSCQAQVDKVSFCNRKGTDKSIEKAIPKGICIPDNYIVDKVVTGFDFNKDAKSDVVLRYSNYPLTDGTIRRYAIYQMVNDTTYVYKKDLSNLAIPYISILTRSYLELHPKADSLFNLYPVNVEISFNSDTITVSHYVPEYYGKTYIYLFNPSEDNWYLTKIRYWIGELPAWLVKNDNLQEKLYGKVYLEDRIINVITQIDNFDLVKSKLASGAESEYLMNHYDLFNWSKK